MDEQNYDETISTSREESLLKAMQIFYESGGTANHKNIERPNISVVRSLVKLFLVLFGYIFCVVTTSVIFYETNLYLVLVIGILIFLCLAFFTLKKTVIISVLLYQKLAPEKLRDSCLFTPSCSEYMILAINKYGVLKGLFLGVKRLLRCHSPNGGEDYP